MRLLRSVQVVNAVGRTRHCADAQHPRNPRRVAERTAGNQIAAVSLQVSSEPPHRCEVQERSKVTIGRRGAREQIIHIWGALVDDRGHVPVKRDLCRDKTHQSVAAIQ
jgi:hypothetical protein